MNHHKHLVRWLFGLLLGLTVLLTVSAALAAGGIDPANKWAWGTNAGWINFAPDNGGVTVYRDHLEGYAWGENIGWIRLGTYTGGDAHTYANNAANTYGVNNDGAGNLSGYAWSTSAGWINFAPANGGVQVDPGTGNFNGYAWGENVGWIHFQNSSPAYLVNTDWRGDFQNVQTGEYYGTWQAAVDAALPGQTVQPLTAGPWPGSTTVNTSGVTINLNGATFTGGSPAFIINADDVTVLGPGVLNGGGNTSPAILVNSGADNFILQDVEILNWANGVEVAGSHASFKLVNNWLHDNTGAGLLLDSGASLSGVITVQGNLFKTNGGNGVQNDSGASLNAQYNSWGDIAGAGGPSGDGVSPNVDASKPTFAEAFVDMLPDTLATQVGVNENAEFNVAIKVDATNLYAVQYKLTYDTNYLTLKSISDGSFKGAPNGSCTNNTATPGVIAVYCTRFSPAGEVSNASGETISIITFQADLPGVSPSLPGPWNTDLDLSTAAADLSSGAKGGIKVFVNNGGFGADSGKPGHTITDANDGRVIISGLANYTGYIDLEGRPNDSGATLTVYNQHNISGAVALADGSSASSGKFTTAYLSPNQLTVPTLYWFQVDARLYLPTTALATSPSFPSLPAQWQSGQVLSARPLTTLSSVLLLGGDANDNNVLDIADLGCIGGAYSGAPAVCGVSGTSDVNGDGRVDIYDLVLAGGNYDKTSSSWTP